MLDLIQDPTFPGPWDRRGLVVGHVQSGKTGHYTGLVCKAADAGYKVIVVIAGVHNNLRNQTQGRIDEGFIGASRVHDRNSVVKRVVGVGRFDNARQPVGLTSSGQDFNKATAQAVGANLAALNEPAVFVIKKEKNALKNLIEWLKPADGAPRDYPLLLIDDEADNASINTGRKATEMHH